MVPYIKLVKYTHTKWFNFCAGQPNLYHCPVCDGCYILTATYEDVENLSLPSFDV